MNKHTTTAMVGGAALEKVKSAVSVVQSVTASVFARGGDNVTVSANASISANDQPAGAGQVSALLMQYLSASYAFM